MYTDIFDYVFYNTDIIKNFITEVFNYYNGKINIFSLAVLNIDLGWYNGPWLGVTRFPNIVTVYPVSAACSVDNRRGMLFNDRLNMFKYYIIQTIVHELHHVDQDFIRYRSSRDSLVEKEVKEETYLYLLGHKQELEKFGVDTSSKYV